LGSIAPDNEGINPMAMPRHTYRAQPIGVVTDSLRIEAFAARKL
jgi:hypothetical protein